MIAALRSAIDTDVVANVAGLTDSNFFYGEAPENTEPGYCVWFGLPYPNDGDSEAILEKIPVQFSFFHDQDKLEVQETVVEALKARYDLGSAQVALSISGYNNLRLMKTLDVPARKVEGVWQRDLEYEIYVSKNRS